MFVFSPSGCTHLVPKLRLGDIRSGFSKELFRHVTSKYPLSDKVLSFLVLKLPDTQSPSHRDPPYDASHLRLRAVLRETTQSAILKPLLKWGVSVMGDDIIEATHALQDSQLDLFETVLSNSNHQEDFFFCLNRACNDAIQRGKTNFVVALIRRGSTPPPDQLVGLEGIFENPYVQSYLDSMRSAMMNRHFEGMMDPTDMKQSKVSPTFCLPYILYQPIPTQYSYPPYNHPLQFAYPIPTHPMPTHIHMCLPVPTHTYTHPIPFVYPIPTHPMPTHNYYVHTNPYLHPPYIIYTHPLPTLYPPPYANPYLPYANPYLLNTHTHPIPMPPTLYSPTLCQPIPTLCPHTLCQPIPIPTLYCLITHPIYPMPTHTLYQPMPTHYTYPYLIFHPTYIYLSLLAEIHQ